MFRAENEQRDEDEGEHEQTGTALYLYRDSHKATAGRQKKRSATKLRVIG